MMPSRRALLLLLVAAAALAGAAAQQATAASGSGSGSSTSGGEPRLSDERCVFQTAYGDVEFGFYPEVAPITAQHIYRLASVGAYNGNHFFRVDKGFVAQVADVINGRNQGPALNAAQKAEADKKVPLEVRSDVKHVTGVVSMGRYDDPNSGTSSFSMLLGNAPHLNMAYTIFGKVTSGMDVLRKLEKLETRKEGIFVMPKERVTISSSYCYSAGNPDGGKLGGGIAGASGCAAVQAEVTSLQQRLDWMAAELHRVRHKCLPGS